MTKPKDNPTRKSPHPDRAITIARRFQWCSGHRVFGHESKCQHVHGHNYVAMVHVAAPRLDDLGRVIDFGQVKQIIGGWIDEHLDHAFLCYQHDDDVLIWLRRMQQRHYVMATNPTAENIAALLLSVANTRMLDIGLACTKVELWETENCCATVVP